MLKKHGKQLVVGRWQVTAFARAEDARDVVALRVFRYWLAVAAGEDPKKRKPADARTSRKRRTPVSGDGR